MTFLLMLAGAALGAWACFEVFNESVGLAGALFGLISGWLFARTLTLRRRLDELQASVDALTTVRWVAGTPDPAQTAPGEAPLRDAERAPRAADALDEPAFASTIAETRASSAEVSAEPILAQTAAAARVETPAPEPQPVESATRAPDVVATPDGPLLVLIKRWVSQGNVPVKVGVIVLFFGVAYLLKYAAEQGWLSVPIEFRFVGVAVTALAALGFAWRKRESHRSFALSLQGGAIGVLILSIFAAYRLYALLPPLLTFGLLVVVVAGAALLAILQDAMALAVLAIFGGFLAPILIATGSGNHVALFSYYALLNAAIFAIAWVKPWRVLNLLGFAFTFGIGTFWGALSYRPELFASTEPFLLLFFAFYLLLPLLYALRLAGDKRDVVDASLVFGTPLVAFALQAALLQGERMPLAFSALAAAAIYTALAALELRRWKRILLGESHALLAIGFVTLAVPLALSAQATACTFALEGAALVWLGLRQQRRVPRWIGYSLQALAGFAFVTGYGGAVDARPVFNGECLGALILSAAALTTSRLLARTSTRQLVIWAFFAWGALWWYFAGGNEIDRLVNDVSPWDVRLGTAANEWLGFLAMSSLLALAVHRRYDWRECLVPAAATIPLGLPFVGFTTFNPHGPLEAWSILAWALWLIATWRALPAIAAWQARLGRILHFVYLWIVALLLGAELAHLADMHAQLSHVWIGLAALAPVAGLFLLALRRMLPARWPLGDAAEPLRTVLLASLMGLLGLGWLIGLVDEGSPTPLPYVPVLNPLELALIGFLVLALLWYRQAESDGAALTSIEFRARALALSGLALLTSITLRSVHFLGGVPWNEGLASSPLAESALSIVWTLAGIAAMLIGKRRGSRAVWFGGAALMAAVLVKLVLIDRQYLHDLPAIIGVLVVGLLLVAVGYFAPAPPKSALAGEAK